ncbi:MAG: hypothetical protein IPP69_13405 [Flavobacteriales bacterium]|nr:hypothetical protein [Flavobacteriales bacterium]
MKTINIDDSIRIFILNPIYMRRLLFLFAFTCIALSTLKAQHRIVWDIPQGDTAAQRGLYKQINNVLTAAPETKIEVVFHGNAVYAMLKDTGYFKEQILDLHKKGVLLEFCNNSLKEEILIYQE